MLTKTAVILDYAKQLGFALTGICNGLPNEDLQFYEWWLEQGFAAEMQFLYQQKDRRKSLNNILPGIQSVVVCALPFPGMNENNSHSAELQNKKITNQKLGKIARYAVGEDYHFILKEKLQALANFIDQQFAGESPKSLAYVDTGAFSERSLARQAGLGWIGKNAMLINRAFGSWFWIGEVLTTIKLSPNQKITTDHCGNCTKCINACPTGAIIEQKRAIDSTKCIAYWNIEHRGPIPEKIHTALNDWLLGCDICQEVCPWNQHSNKQGRAKLGEPLQNYMDLETVLNMEEEHFKKFYKNTAISRPKLSGLKRNASIISNN